MGYDLRTKANGPVLTHAKALKFHEDYELVGAVDTSLERLATFSENYCLPGFSSVEEIPGFTSVDLVVIATPTETHWPILSRAVEELNPRAVLCEKPLAYSIQDAESIVDFCSNRSVDLWVNYPRRVNPAVQRVKTIMSHIQQRSRFSGVARYGKGLVHNGTHMLDMLDFWFGSPRSFTSSPKALQSHSAFDEEVSSQLVFERGEILLEAQGPQSGIFDLRLSSDDGTLEYTDGGNWVSWVSTSDKGTSELSSFIMEDAMSTYQDEVYTAISRSLAGGPMLLPSGVEALKTLALAKEIMRMVMHNE